jgi:hypothetical protein
LTDADGFERSPKVTGNPDESRRYAFATMFVARRFGNFAFTIRGKAARECGDSVAARPPLAVV